MPEVRTCFSRCELKHPYPNKTVRPYSRSALTSSMRSIMSLAINSTIKLKNGSLPRLGLGVYQSRGDECYDAVRCAVEAGYKHSASARNTWSPLSS